MTLPLVTLLRDPPHERRLSMERYADCVQAGVVASGRYRIEPVALQRERIGWQWHYDRLAAYTVNAGRRNGDLFHIVDHGFAHLATWLPRDRTIVTCHDLMALRSVMGQTGARSRAITVARFRWSVSHMRSVAHVACDSTATRDDAIELVGVPEDRVTVIPLGVEDRFRPLGPHARAHVRRELGLDGRIVIANVATGSEYKNPAGVLRTLRVLHDRGVPAVLLCAGRGFATQHLELQHRLGLDGFVVERGLVDEEQLIETYNASDVVLHPSYWEGFGWPPLEAMSCGTPVVTSTAPSLLEVTAGAALAASPDDHAGLADLVQEALREDTAERLRRRGLARAERMRWQPSIDALLDVYSAVADRATSAPRGRLRPRRSLAAGRSQAWPVRPPISSAAGGGARARICRDVLRELSVNTAMAIPAIQRQRLRRPRNSSAFDGSVELLDRYAFQAVRGLERLVGPVRDRSVIEFGPGDHLAAGLSQLAAGASRYTALDRFVPDYASPAAKRWYDGVHAHWAERFPGHPWPDGLRPQDFPEAYPDRVITLAEGVEGPATIRHRETYDIVTSWQVGEHVSDIRSFAELTAQLLAPGGVAVHRVDFGPHDCWLRYEDPLTFLRFPPTLWRAMSSHRGSPNRRRHHEFVAALSASGLVVTCENVATFDLRFARVTQLHACFRDMPLRSLEVRDVIYVCRRPPEPVL